MGRNFVITQSDLFKARKALEIIEQKGEQGFQEAAKICGKEAATALLLMHHKASRSTMEACIKIEHGPNFTKNPLRVAK